MHLNKFVTRILGLTLLLVAGLQQHTLASEDEVQNTMPKFLAATNSKPGLVIPRSAKFSWLFSDVDIKADAPVTEKGIKDIIQEEIEKAMQAKGFSVAASGKPADFFIAYTAATESTLDDDTLLRRYKVSPGYHVGKEEDSVYEKGTLVIHIVNAETRETVWQSAAQGGVQEGISDAQRHSNIGKIVTVMLSRLPVK
jgi:hypothetical protein